MPVSTRKHYPIQTMNRSHFAFTRHAPRAQGFSLVEMAMVLLVVGLLAALFLPATNTMMARLATVSGHRRSTSFFKRIALLARRRWTQTCSPSHGRS